MAGPAFVSVKPGSLITANGKLFKVSHVLGLDYVLAQDVQNKLMERIPIGQIRTEQTLDDGAVAGGPDLDGIDVEEWKVAQWRYEVIKPLVEDPLRTRKKAEDIARSANVHVATVYDWLRSFLDSRHLSCLLPQKRGRRPGSKRLDRAVETVIEAAVNELYLSNQKQRPQEVVNEVAMRCKTAGLPAPHPNTVRNRIRSMPAALVLRRRGMRDKARNTFEPIQGGFPGADFPLAVVQIDHTEADIIVVEENTRLPMGRPWITLAIDVHCRVVVGCYVSMEKPSAVAAGMCLSRAMLPKGEYLADLGVPGEWPVWGKIRAVHADNAKEFRGAMLQTACQAYAIDLQLRPVKRPHYGGHIERLMGTSANEVRKLPGATFSSPKERNGYDSEKNSALTLAEFEQHLVDFIVNVYHKRRHGGIDTTPIHRWQQGIVGDDFRPGVGLPDVPADPAKLRLDFLPFVKRTVQPYGIVIDDVHYYHEVLNTWINATDPESPKYKRQFIVRRDPRDISEVYFYDPQDNQYYAIPYRDPSHPAISLWELKAAQQRIKEQGAAEVDEAAIFEAVLRMRSRVEDAISKTKAARRQHHRINTTKRSAKLKRQPVSVPPPLDKQVGSTDPEDIFSGPATPFEDLRVRQ